jgi:hypothetical protein
VSAEPITAGRWEFGQALGAEERLAVEAERTSFNLRRARLIVAPLLVVMIILQVVFAWVVVPVDPAQQVWRDNAMVLTNLMIGCFALALLTINFLPSLAAHAVDALIPCSALWGALSSANIQRTRPAVDLFLVANFTMVLVVRPRLRSLVATSPFNVLARGYSITRRVGDKTPLGDANAVKPGEKLETRLASGVVISTVERAQDA